MEVKEIAVMRNRHSRAARIPCWMALVALVALSVATAAYGASPPQYSQVMLRELPHQGALSDHDVTLAEVAAKRRQLDHATSLLVYLCAAGAAWRPPLPRAAAAELEAINHLRGQDRPAGGVVPIAIISLVDTNAEALDGVCAALQEALRAAPSIPLYLDVRGEITRTLEAEQGREVAVPPSLFLLSTDDLEITAFRGSAPVRADTWFAQQETAGAEPALPDPPGVPADCARSWFRRHIARVVQAGAIALDSAGLFHPQQPVGAAELAGWLGKIAPARTDRILDDYGLARPETVTRQQAFAATARFLWGDDPAAPLAAGPPPAGRGGADPATLWRQSFRTIPGAEYVDPDLEPYLVLALARGLLYDEPALNATGELTREVAAWLLDHCLPPGPEEPTGVVVDVVDLPFIVDSTGRSSRGASLLALPNDEGGVPHRVYPADSPLDRLPSPEQSYPSVYCTPGAEPETSQWLVLRVGEHPLHITAQSVVGESGRGRQVTIAPAGAEALRKWNERRGLLDNWRVAFRYGVGARLLTPLQGPVSREPAFAIRFSQQMREDTASDRLVWLRPAGEVGARVPTVVAWRQPGWELAVRPAAPLAPDREYELVLAADLRSAKGEPITVRDERLRSQGEARCWRFTTDSRLRVYVGISGVPDGTKVYLPDRADALVTPLRTSPLVLVKPGPLEVRFETPDGGSFVQSQVVAQDCTIRLPMVASPPSQVQVAGIPEEMAPGQQVTLTLRAEDVAGALLSQATPVTVTAEAQGCVLASGPAVRLERGEGRLVLSAERPGKVVVTLSSSEAGVPVRPRQVVIYCRYSPPAEPAWSPAERHLLPPVARGARDVQITPRWRRWLALGTANAVRVVDPDGGEFTRIPQGVDAPGSREFWVDDLGVLHFPPAVAGKTVELSYQYREPRCAAVIVGLPEGDALHTAVATVLADVFRELGYQQVPSAELAATWGGGDPAAHVAAVEEVRTAMRLFGLTELFVLALGASEDGSYRGVWTIWTAETGPVTRWASGGAEAPVMSLRRRRPDTTVEAAYLRRELMQSLRPWFAQKGMEASRTLVERPPR
jgi:hypothetical protein